ncbi:MAG: cobalt ABC transporter permease [Nitrospiraceae bacterium]|nr:MAG: cobalt ABC transporter permease [Nitrospiraceae bacterium]
MNEKLRVRSLELRVEKTENWLSRLLFTTYCLLFAVLLLVTCHSSLVTAAEWSGVDESVVEKYAKDHGREAKEPLINTDQGDLLLFMFLIGGVIGGFAAGYYWRTLTEDRAKN